MVKYYFKTGKEFKGNTHKMKDGSIHTGKNHTKTSKTVVRFSELSERAKVTLDRINNGEDFKF